LTRESIRRKYHRHAKLYDLDDALFFGTKQKLRRRVIELAGIEQGTKVLDLMVGTGDTTILAAKAGAIVTSVDFSGPMLAVARRKLERRGLENVGFIQSDAEDLPFEDASFDAVICTYGLDTVYDPASAVSEMARVARPSAPVVAACKADASGIGRAMDALVSLYLRTCWKCRSVDVVPVFKEAGLEDVREERFYAGMGRVTSGRKPPE